MICDLGAKGAREEGEVGNVLLDLAACAAGTGSVVAPGKPHEWKSAFDKWHKTAALDARELVVSIYQWRRPWPVVRILEHVPEAQRTSAYWMERGWAQIQAGLYFSALNALCAGLEQPDVPMYERMKLEQGIGFALWRLGRLGDAARTLKGVRSANVPNEERVLVAQGDALRNYAEVVADILRHTPQSERADAWREWDTETACGMLRVLPQAGPENERLVQIVVANIRRLTGGGVEVAEMLRLYCECMAAEYYIAAAACARVVVHLSFEDGERAVAEVERPLRELGLRQHIRQNRVAAAEARYPRAAPFVRWLLGEGRVWASLRTVARESQFVIKRCGWRAKGLSRLEVRRR